MCPPAGGIYVLALKECPECKGSVSSKADTCPHCGNVLRAAPAKGGGGIGCLVVLSLVGIGVYACVQSLPPAPPADPADTACAADWHQCTSNEQFVTKSNEWTKVKAACKTQADFQVRYGAPQWGWLWFSTYLRGKSYIVSGQVMAMDTEAKVQNQFGAYEKVHMTCDYDLGTGKVSELDIVPAD